MLSLIILFGLLIGSILLHALAAALAARAVGSPRGRFRTALVAVVACGLLGGGVGYAWGAAAAAAATEKIGSVLALLVLPVQLALVLVVFRRVFRLSHVRAVAPAAACVALSAALYFSALGPFRRHVAHAVSMHSTAMSPAVEPGDRMVINKLLSPRRWDIIAYRPHDAAEPVLYAHRLVGLPGERLRFEDGRLCIDDQPTAPPVTLRYTAAPLPVSPLYRYRDGQTITLGPDEFFVVGDNVERSADSRVRGPTPRSHLEGVIDLRYWPPGRPAILR